MVDDIMLVNPYYCVLDATPKLHGYFGHGCGPIFLDNVNCAGDEHDILRCPHDYHTADCTHAEDAGVTCNKTCMYIHYILD